MNERDAAELYAHCCLVWGESASVAVRQAWTKALADVDRAAVEARIQSLINAGHVFMPRLPEIVGTPKAAPGVIQRDGCTFVPGTGWLGGVHPDAGTAPALLPGSNADAVPSGISGARAHAARAARPRAAASDPEIVRQVDEAAARLRQSPQDRPDVPGGSDPTGAGPAGAPDPLSGSLVADDEASARAAGRAIGEAILADLDAGGDGDMGAVLEIRSPDPEITGGGWGDEVHRPAGASVADFEAGMTELRRQLKDGWS
jgi:hypothetical protein